MKNEIDINRFWFKWYLVLQWFMFCNGYILRKRASIGYSWVVREWRTRIIAT